MRAFAAIFDDRRPATNADVTRLRSSLGSDAHVRCAGPLALAWTRNTAPSRSSPVWFVDGTLYASPSDLDLLLREDAPSALRALRGDFAALYFDEERRRGWVAVDQLGCGSVVWHSDGARLLLASDVKYLLPLLASRPGPDPASLAHWLALSGTPVDRTMFDGVRALPAAHFMPLDPAHPVPRRYWAPTYRASAASSRDDQAAGLREMLTQSVGRRCDGQATGVLLSGGLDSSAVAAIASRLPDDARPRRSYSATFPDHPSVDEAALIDVTCASLGLESTRAVVRAGSVIGGASGYIAAWDVPPPSPNLYFWFPLLRRAAADGQTALLDGEGGDEVFGVPIYLTADRLRRGRLRDAARLVRSLPGGRPDLEWARVKPFLVDFGLKGAAPAWLHRAVRRVRKAGVPDWLRPELRRALSDTDFASEWRSLSGPRWWAHQTHRITRSSAYALTLGHVRRRAAMCGLESRHPFLDVDVVEYALSLPPESAFDPRFSRPTLREAVRGVLPDDVRLRPSKSTFDSVFHESLAGCDLDDARSLLSQGSQLRAYVDLDRLLPALLEPPPPGRRMGWAIQLWRFVTAECWLRDQDGRDALAAPRTSRDGAVDVVVARAAS